MKRPPTRVMVMGHPIVFYPAGAMLLWLGYLWATGQAEGLGAFVMLFIATACGKAHERYEKYRQWKRDWDAMSGRVPRRWFSARAARMLAATVAWCLMAMLASDANHRPDLRWAGMLFWFGTAIGVVSVVVRRFRAPAARRNAKNVSVTLSMRVPGHSPAVAQAYAALPDYCRHLLPRR